MKDLIKTITISIMFTAILTFIGVRILAHEGGPHKFSHMTEGPGPLVGQTYCGSYMVWHHGDVNGTVIKCSGVFMDHDVIHMFPTRMTLTPGENGKPEISCSCDPVATEQGGTASN